MTWSIIPGQRKVSLFMILISSPAIRQLWPTPSWGSGGKMNKGFRVWATSPAVKCLKLSETGMIVYNKGSVSPVLTRNHSCEGGLSKFLWAPCWLRRVRSSKPLPTLGPPPRVGLIWLRFLRSKTWGWYLLPLWHSWELALWGLVKHELSVNVDYWKS